jgi:geranylgeranyl reductase family protein
MPCQIVERCDVGVIGAGPAGARTAYLLARDGARVVLFDPSHPREKPCGGGVTGRALALLRDTPEIADLPAVRIRRARFRQGGCSRASTIELDVDAGDSTPSLLVASRRDFDGTLLAAAERSGARLIPRRVIDIDRSGSGFSLATADGGRHYARVIVGADGANSLVRRRLGRPFSRTQLSVATGYYAFVAPRDEIVIEFVADPAGYLWSFPRVDHLAVGICAPADSAATMASLRERTRQWLRGLTETDRLVPYSWPIPSLSLQDFQTLTPAGPGWLLVGDAAGLVDPITREGIFFALQSAQLAAGAIGSQAADPARLYTARVRAEIGSELTRAARFKATFFQPRFTRLLLDAVATSRPIARVMVDLLAGAQSYRTLRWRLASTLEIGWALKAICEMSRSHRAHERERLAARR